MPAFLVKPAIDQVPRERIMADRGVTEEATEVASVVCLVLEALTVFFMLAQSVLRDR